MILWGKEEEGYVVGIFMALLIYNLIQKALILHKVSIFNFFFLSLIGGGMTEFSIFCSSRSLFCIKI